MAKTKNLSPLQAMKLHRRVFLAEEREAKLVEVLTSILTTNQINVAKELAAEVLEVDVEDYLNSDLDKLSFSLEEGSNNELDYGFLDEDRG